MAAAIHSQATDRAALEGFGVPVLAYLFSIHFRPFIKDKARECSSLNYPFHLLLYSPRLCREIVSPTQPVLPFPAFLCL